MITGLIPARGGSKGIPRKNLAILGDETILTRGVKLLNQAGCDQVWVSSDDDEILRVASNAGAGSIVRPHQFSDDMASTESVILDSIDQLKLKAQDLIVVHQITSPFLSASSVRKCIEKLIATPSLNSVLVGSVEHSFQWEETEVGEWNPKNHSREYRPRRQELKTIIRESGGVYVTRVSAVLQSQSRFPAPTFCIPISFLESLDIDTPEDLEVARIIQRGINYGKF